MDIKNLIITIVGLAKSGQAAARLASELGAKVRITEMASADKVNPDFIEWVRKNNICCEFGGHTEQVIQGSSFVVTSPGVPFNAQPLNWARAAGIPVIGELEFAYRFCPCPIIAVTGSNGKTTVTTLIGRILAASGKKVFVGGNIGNPLSDHVMKLTKDYVAVLEVSSFQMETIEHFHPKVAVLLNISQNHLDRHKDMEEYIQAKARIFMNQTDEDTAVLNEEDNSVMSLSASIAAKKILFNNFQQAKSWTNPNFRAAAAAASVFSIGSEIWNNVFKEFRGIEHRLEVVRTINGVTFINDSKSTTTEASRWALVSLKGPIIWICGGRDKNLDFSVLKDLAATKVKKIIAIGEAAGKISDSFGEEIQVECHTKFDEAVRGAFQQAGPAGTVLLSPMCASYDMFDNFEHRGREFKRIVNEL
ncbi:MAG: UDP-N-acetylmuramoyl-L-alanine--D-glutamate ligase [Candidatus Omnitrophota bacterium]